MFWCFTFLLFPQSSISGQVELVNSAAEEYKDGPDVEILAAIADKLNAKLKFKLAVFKRRLQLMKDGEIDFMSGLLKSAEAGGLDLIYKMGIADRVETADCRFAREKHGHIGISKKSHLMANLSTIECVIESMIDTGEIKRIIAS